MPPHPSITIGKSWRILIPLGIGLAICLASYWYWNYRRIAEVGDAARLAYRQRNLDQADREIDRWIELLPKSGEPWYWKARVELAREHPQETMAALNKAHALGHPEADLKVITAIMRVLGGKTDQMEPILKQAFEVSNDSDPELDQALSRLYLATFRFGLATETLQRWMKDAPDDPRPYLWLNEIEGRSSTDSVPLIRNYREALKRDPSLVEARLGLANTLRTSRRAAEAAQEYDTFLKSWPKSVEANRGAGQVAMELGNTDDAIKYFHLVLALNPKDAVALRELALLDIRTGEYNRASDRLKSAIEVDPFDPDLRSNLAKALKLAGKMKESEGVLAAAERLRKEQDFANDLRQKLIANPSDTQLRFNAAQWLLDHGHDKEGLEWAELILHSKPGDQETCLLLAKYHKSKGNIGLANYYRLAATPSRQSSSR